VEVEEAVMVAEVEAVEVASAAVEVAEEETVAVVAEVAVEVVEEETAAVVAEVEA
jgi:hypothetical protein